MAFVSVPVGFELFFGAGMVESEQGIMERQAPRSERMNEWERGQSVSVPVRTSTEQ